MTTTTKLVVLCALGLLLVELGSGAQEFKITVEQNQPSLAPIDFVLYFNETIPGAAGHEPLIWAAGSLSQAPSSFGTVLHQSHAGLSAVFHVGDQTYSEGPILAFQPNNTHWLLSVRGDNVLQFSVDGSPHKPVDGLRVTLQNGDALSKGRLSVRRHEGWTDFRGVPFFGPPLGYAADFGGPWIDFPPVLSLTLTETFFEGDASAYLGQPVSSLRARGVSTTFKVIPATSEVSWQVNLARRTDSTRTYYLPTYTYTFN